MSSVGRLDPNNGNPTLKILGPNDGLGSGWVELYILDGTARFHLGNNLYRFDDSTQKFISDRELLARFPKLAISEARPITERLGRFWYTA